jgi:hypothetical protein
VRITAEAATGTDVNEPPKNWAMTPRDGSCANIDTRTEQAVKSPPVVVTVLVPDVTVYSVGSEKPAALM